MNRQSNTAFRRRGNVLIYTTAAMVAFTGILALAIDTGHVRLVRNELQFAADAAARYAAAGLATDVTTAQNNAVFAAGELYADGSKVVVSATNDVIFGTWSGGTFTVLTGTAQSGANAVKVTCRHTTAGGNPVKTIFAAMLGISSADVTVSTIATYRSATAAGMTGLNGITVHDNFFVASYDSSVTTTPTQTSSNSNGQVLSNAAIIGHNGDIDHGNATLGPSGSVSSLTVIGSTVNQGTAIAAPSVTMQHVTNPGGVSQTPVIANGQTVTWPGGTYYFTSITMNDSGTINFSGAATIYLDGSASAHDNNSITAFNRIPSNLVVYQASGNTFYLHDSDNFVGSLIAPGCAFTLAHDHNNWYGSLFADSISINDNCNFYCDEKISGGVVSISIVK